MAGPGRIGGLLLGRRGPAAPSPGRGEILAEPGRERAGTGGGRPGGRRGRGSGPGAMGTGFFRALSPHQGVRQEIPPPSSLFLGRASVSPDAESVTRRGEERGIGAFVQSVAGSGSGRSRSLLRLVGPLPAQDLFRAGRPPVATTLDRPSLRSCPRLFVWSLPPGDRPRSSHSLPGEKRGSWSSGDGSGRGQKRPEEEEGAPVFSLSSPILSPLPPGPSPGVLFPPCGFSGDFVEESGTIGDQGDRVPNRPSPVPLCERRVLFETSSPGSFREDPGFGCRGAVSQEGVLPIFWTGF